MTAMADGVPPGTDRAAAIRAVGTWVTKSLGAIELSTVDLSARNRGLTHGWRIGFTVAEQQVLIDLAIDEGFPHTKAEVYWVDPPPFPSIPHVEKNGRLCVLPSTATINPFESLGVVKKVLAGVQNLFSQGLRGENVDDFRVEFRSYWNEIATGRSVVSIVDPCEPSRTVVGWARQKTFVVAETSQSMRDWAQNAVDKRNIANAMLTRVPLIWLPQMPIPSEYPKTESDVARLVATAGEGAIAIYERAICDDVETSLVLFGAENAGSGITLCAVTLSRKRSGFDRSARRVKGFRRHVPEELLRANRKSDVVNLSRVTRADPWWIHGRDSQDDLETLLGATVAIIGCGSLGSPLARLLCQAGVGRIILIDPEPLSYANVGRHALGADAVTNNKAVALKHRLQREYPHLRIDARPETWQRALQDENDGNILAECDLLISSIGGWDAECALNQSLLRAARSPKIIYTWAEPEAAGGHAVLVGTGGGCLACGLSSFGGALLSVAHFAEPTLRREPACGAFFQPYGSADINSIASMAASFAIDTLYDRAVAGDHRIMAMTAEKIAAVGGTLTDEWVALSNGQTSGGNQAVRRWVPRDSCPYCAGRGA